MKYTVTGKSVELTGGLLTITAEQAANRKHLLKATDKKSQYEIIKPVVFKHGEEFGYEGDLPKGIGADSEGDDPPGENTVAGLKAKLDGLKIAYDSKAKKADLENLLAEYAAKLADKALELSQLDQAGFDALSEEQRAVHIEAAKAALAN